MTNMSIPVISLLLIMSSGPSIALTLKLACVALIVCNFNYIALLFLFSQRNDRIYGVTGSLQWDIRSRDELRFLTELRLFGGSGSTQTNRVFAGEIPAISCQPPIPNAAPWSLLLSH